MFFVIFIYVVCQKQVYLTVVELSYINLCGSNLRIKLKINKFMFGLSQDNIRFNVYLPYNTLIFEFMQKHGSGR